MHQTYFLLTDNLTLIFEPSDRN